MLTAAIVCAALAQLPPLTAKTADEYLTQLQAEESEYFARLETIAQSFVGVKYAKDPLGEGGGTAFDRDPLIDLSRVDGFTFIDQCLALAGSRTLEEATEAIKQIRYIRGEVDYARRNHLFVEEWTINNAFVTNITPELGVPMQKTLRFVNKVEYLATGGRGLVGGSIPGEGSAAPKRKPSAVETLFADIRAEPITVAFISGQDVAQAAPKIPDNSLIAIIGKGIVYYAENCALHFRDGDGAGKIYYASPDERRVVVGTLEDLLTDSIEYIGILVYSIHPERMAFVEQAEPEPHADAAPSEADTSSETATP